MNYPPASAFIGGRVRHDILNAARGQLIVHATLCVHEIGMREGKVAIIESPPDKLICATHDDSGRMAFTGLVLFMHEIVMPRRVLREPGGLSRRSLSV